ncbi:MAG: PsbP-related protein, partial [Candidatus Aerophobetes bacterium]|nr:PsbP-related protein [Candidatus Aerophobetes bacterium]
REGGGGQTTTTQKYSSEQYKFSFDYPQEWKVQEQQGTVNVTEPQNLAWITMWRITENVDPQTFLQNLESQLKQQWQNFTVTSRKQVIINGVDALRVAAQSTSSQGASVIHTLLVLYRNNLAKVMVVSTALKNQYANLSPTLEQVFNSVTLLDEGRTATTPPQTSQQTQQPAQTTQTPRVAGWFRYQMSELLPINQPMAVTYIEYPKDWQVMPDYYQIRVTFSKDSGGTISFTLCPMKELINPTQRTASEFFQLLLGEMSQEVPDLNIAKQDFPQFQNIAGTIVSEGRVELRGTKNGMAMTCYVWINYFYSSGYPFSMGSAIFALAQAPTLQFPDIKGYIFDRMVKTFVDSFPKTQPAQPERK